MKTLLAVAVCLAVITTAGACFAQTQLASDNFDAGINGTYLGPNWTGCGYNNGAYNKLVYQNNEAGGSGFWGQDCALYTGYGAFPSDQYATGTIVAPTPSSTPEAAIQLRANATPFTSESYIACGWNAQDFPADYHYRIWSLAPNPPTGGPTSLYLSTVRPATNDVVWCQALGSTVTMEVNGTTIASVTDTSGITSGYPGLYYIDPNGGAPQSNDVIFDKFVAGHIVSPVLYVCTIPPSGTQIGGNGTSWNKFNTAGSSDVVWINMHIGKPSGVPTNQVTTVQFTGVSFVLNGKTYGLPDGFLIFNPSAPATPTTTYNSSYAPNGSWTTTLNPSNLSDEIFVDGQAVPVDSNISGGGTANITYITESTDNNLSFNWQWSAAEYTYWPGNNAAEILPYHQSLHAGTPLNTTVEHSLIQGPRGGGGSNYTGGWSGTGHGTCPSSQ